VAAVQIAVLTQAEADAAAPALARLGPPIRAISGKLGPL